MWSIKIQNYKKYIKFNSEWKFCLESQIKGGNPSLINFDDSYFKNIDLPHDYSITKPYNLNSPAQNEGALLDGGIGYYRKVFFLDKQSSGKHIELLVSGAIGTSMIYLNGKLIGINYNSYTKNYYDLSPYLIYGENNVILIKTANIQPSSRWYSGSGLFRDVFLVISLTKHYLLDREVKLTTPDLQKTYEINNVKLNIEMPLHLSDVDATHLLKFKVTFKLLTYDNEERIIYEEILNKGKAYTSSESLFTLKESVALSNLKLWSPTKPNLYYVVLTVSDENGQELDSFKTRYGFRYISFTKEGFFLNGINTPIKGVCLHHDNGMLGACDYLEPLHRKLKLLKEMGCNAIRSSHNMASDKLVYLCDKLGFLLQDEAFDTWYQGKRKYDYHRYFENVTKLNNPRKLKTPFLDLEKIVLRDRNYPSVFMYSLGNEIDETHNPDEKTYRWLKEMLEFCKQLDDTRPYTIGQNGYSFVDKKIFPKIDKLESQLDLVGLNYGNLIYDDLQSRHPEWIYFGCETSSAVKSRGIYIDEQEALKVNVCDKKHRNRRHQYYLNSYGTDCVSWGSTAVESYKFATTKRNYFGEFIWTGFDYLGEPTPWLNDRSHPIKSSYFGIIDLAGIPKEDYYFYKSVWNPTIPTIKILPHNNFTSKDEVSFKKINYDFNKTNLLYRVYSNAEQVELIQNGVEIDRKTRNELSLSFDFRITYKPGSVKAIGFNKDQQIICSETITTTDKPKSVHLEAEEIYEGDNYLRFIKFSIRDRHGLVVPMADNDVKFSLKGKGYILGVDNGNAKSLHKLAYEKTDRHIHCSAYNGYGVIVIKKDCLNAKVTLYASSKRLKSSKLKITL